MADIEHGVITDPNIHEPKGASTASVGDVYTSDGSGSGTWQRPSYGGMQVIAGTTAFTPGAADVTDFYHLNGIDWADDIHRGIVLTTDGVGDSITVTDAGIYSISFWATISSAAASGTKIAFKYSIGGVLAPRAIKVQKHTAGSDFLHIAATALGSFSAGDVLTLHAASSATTTFTLINASFTLHRVT